MFDKLKEYVKSKNTKTPEQIAKEKLLKTELPCSQLVQLNRMKDERSEDLSFQYEERAIFLFKDSKINFNKENKDTRVIMLTDDNLLGQMFNYQIVDNEILIDTGDNNPFRVSKEQLIHKSGFPLFYDDVVTVKKAYKRIKDRNLREFIKAQTLSLANAKNKTLPKAESNADEMFK